MKNSILCATLILTVASILHSSGAHEACPAENCLTPEKCEEFVHSASVTCPNKADRCCSIVRTEFRNRCRHFGGECMNRCAQTLIRKNAQDCAKDQVCCVLV